MKRFYQTVTVAEVPGGWQVMLDGRGIRTADGAPQIVPRAPLAELLAAEWAAQGDVIDPHAFAMRDLADYAIDIVAPDPAAAIDGLIRFAETDTLCYRADPEDALYRRQQEVWEPLLAALEAREGLAFHRISGVGYRAQPPAALAALRARLGTFNPFALAALQTLASLAASLTIALAAAEPGGDVPALWDAATLEEEWQADLWGRDAEAEDRRAKKRAEFLAAARFLAAAMPG